MSVAERVKRFVCKHKKDPLGYYPGELEFIVHDITANTVRYFKTYKSALAYSKRQNKRGHQIVVTPTRTGHKHWCRDKGVRLL